MPRQAPGGAAGAGKRDGYRTIVAYRKEDRAFFLNGFAKNERSNVDKDTKEAFEDFGGLFLAYEERPIQMDVESGDLRELGK